VTRLLACLFILLCSPVASAGTCRDVSTFEPSDPCTTRIVTFNGIWTTYAQARKNTNALRALYGTRGPDGENLTYTLLYNQSGGPDSMVDLVETFEQLLEEEEDGVLAGRFELFFSALHCGGDWWDHIVSVLPRFRDFLERPFGHAVERAAALFIEHVIDDPPTLDDYACHKAQLDAWDSAHLVFVAHSQGNLFADAAYDYLVSTGRSDEVRVVHVAPPMTALDGPYVLADIDFVINGLLGTFVPVLAPNAYASSDPGDLGDCLGHNFLSVYLGDKTLADAVKNAMTRVLRDLPSSVIFEREDGDREDVTSVFAAGTEKSPVRVSLEEPGTLYVCEGTWYAGVEATADIEIVGAPDRDTCILDGAGIIPTLLVKDGISVDVSHLTLKRGNNAGGGGSISCANFGIVHGDDVVIEGNGSTVMSYGGAIYLGCGCELSLEHARVRHGSALDGGLMIVTGSSAYLDDVIFSDGHADGGGAISAGANNTCGGPGRGLVACTDCGFSNNSALVGGAVALGSADFTMSTGGLGRAFFSGNSATEVPIGGTKVEVGSSLSMSTALPGGTATFSGVSMSGDMADIFVGRWGFFSTGLYYDASMGDFECTIVATYGPADTCDPATLVP
jgi:hypothetical protein